MSEQLSNTIQSQCVMWLSGGTTRRSSWLYLELDMKTTETSISAEIFKQQVQEEWQENKIKTQETS